LLFIFFIYTCDNRKCLKELLVILCYNKNDEGENLYNTLVNFTYKILIFKI